MKKNFEIPMLQVLSIKKNDIIVTSGESIKMGNSWDGSSTILAPGQRGLDDWYEGY